MTPPVIARKRADLLSIVGAAVAGAGLGAWLATSLRPWAGMLLVVGLLAHAAGMGARHAMESREAPLPAAWQWLYWLCWLAIAALVIMVLRGALE